MTTQTTLERIQLWLDGPYDEKTKETIRELQNTDPKALSDAFFKDLSFGTGGLRAKMGLGTNRLNLYTIRLATQGLANYLNKQPLDKRSVFIGYDVRRHSAEFALEAARVLAGNQIRAMLTEDICPTPLVSFGCRYFECQAAIMITASHNPPEYNGYKVYWSDGGQIVAPHDQGIIEEVKKIQNFFQVLIAPEDSPLIERIGGSLDEAYLEKLSSHRLYPHLPSLDIIYTPLHGTGIRILPQALQSWGFSCSLVDKQKTPDGQFPHVKTPNPEEPQALELGAEMMIEREADLLLGTDPDADRVGAAVLHQGAPVYLTGNQIACLCLEHLCEALVKQNALPKESACIKTIVTTELFRKIAESYKTSCFDVLTGFKYIAAEIEKWQRSQAPYHYLFGGEESFGYLFGTFVRDKDAISSSCLIAEAAASAKQHGMTLVDKLYQLYLRYGVHRESLTNISLPDNQEGLNKIQHLMDSLRTNPPSEINGQPLIQIDDYLSSQSKYLPTNTLTPIPLPSSNVLRFWLQDNSKLVIRPSGTEPKMKIYAEVFEHSPDIHKTVQSCDARLHDLVQNFQKLHLAN